MPALGHLGYFATVKEGTWGTNPGSGFGFGAISSETMKVDQKFKFIESVHNNRQTIRKVPLGIRAAGNVVWEANVEELMGDFLYSLLPTQVTTDNGSGNGGLHEFTPGNTIPAGITALISRDTTVDATNIWQFVGGRVGKMSFQANEGDTLKCTTSLTFKSGTAGATGASPSYSTENPLVYHTGTFTVDGAAVAIKSFQLDIDGGLHADRGQIGSKYIQQQLAGIYKVSGSLDLYFDSMTAVNAYLAGTDGKIVLELDGSALGTSTRKMIFTIPTAQYTAETPSIASAAQEIMLKMPFTAYQSGSGSPDALVKVSLLNSKRTDY